MRTELGVVRVAITRRSTSRENLLLATLSSALRAVPMWSLRQTSTIVNYCLEWGVDFDALGCILWVEGRGKPTEQL
jgi:hypothetical protein